MGRAMISKLKTAAAVVALGLSASAFANFPSLASKLPPASNAIIAVNVVKVMDSPFAKSEEWAKTAADSWAKQPLMIPPARSAFSWPPRCAPTRWSRTGKCR